MREPRVPGPGTCSEDREGGRGQNILWHSLIRHSESRQAEEQSFPEELLPETEGRPSVNCVGLDPRPQPQPSRRNQQPLEDPESHPYWVREARLPCIASVLQGQRQPPAYIAQGCRQEEPCIVDYPSTRRCLLPYLETAESLPLTPLSCVTYGSLKPGATCITNLLPFSQRCVTPDMKLPPSEIVKCATRGDHTQVNVNCVACHPQESHWTVHCVSCGTQTDPPATVNCAAGLTQTPSPRSVNCVPRGGTPVNVKCVAGTQTLSPAVQCVTGNLPRTPSASVKCAAEWSLPRAVQCVTPGMPGNPTASVKCAMCGASPDKQRETPVNVDCVAGKSYQTMPKPRAEDQSERERREGVPSKPQKWNLGLRPERGVIPSYAPFLVNPTNIHNTQESTLLPDTAFSAEYQAMFQPLPEDSIDPPPPQPLLFLPFMVNNRVVHALLDSGASDCFISETLVAELRLPRKRLKQPMSVRVASGTSLSVD